MLDVLGKIFFW